MLNNIFLIKQIDKTIKSLTKQNTKDIKKEQKVSFEDFELRLINDVLKPDICHYLYNTTQNNKLLSVAEKDENFRNIENLRFQKTEPTIFNICAVRYGPFIYDIKYNEPNFNEFTLIELMS